MKRSFQFALAMLGWIAPLTLAVSNVDDAHKFSWGENVGWMNWRDANSAADGVIVGSGFLSGWVWGENAGWINVGNGNGPYGNVTGTDFGVNILGNGDLEGFAWGENIGWVNFDTSSHAPNQARYDVAAGRFRGYAWGENIGWINLDDAAHYVGVTGLGPLLPDPNGVCSGGSTEGADCDDDADCLGGGTCVSEKCCFISFRVPSTAGAETAIRVSSNSLHHPVPPYAIPPTLPFTTFEAGTCIAPGEAAGCTRWVGPPATFIESEAVVTPFQAASLRCTPHYQVWPTNTTIHVYGAEIVPSSVYDLEHVAASCQGNEASCTAVSAAVQIATTRWGDVDGAYNPPAPTTQPDAIDIGALVDKFRSQVGAPLKAQGLMAANDLTVALSQDLGFNEIAACVNAFQGFQYPNTGPCVCPSTAICPALDACGRCTP